MRDDNQDPDRAGGSEEIEREARRAREFDLSAAVARAAGGQLKGASPVPAVRQTVLDAGHLLAARLPDPEGSLMRTLLARLEDDLPLLDRCRNRPEAALAALLDRALASPAALADLVREVDARWGRDYDERPRFEAGDKPPAADDPYTLERVRTLLAGLRAAL